MGFRNNILNCMHFVYFSVCPSCYLRFGYFGPNFRWEAAKSRLSCSSDEDLAKFLLDHHFKVPLTQRDGYVEDGASGGNDSGEGGFADETENYRNLQSEDVKVEGAMREADTKALLEAFEISLREGLGESTSSYSNTNVKKENVDGLQPKNKTTKLGSPLTDSTNLGGMEDEEEQLDDNIDTVIQLQNCHMKTDAPIQIPLLEEKASDDIKCNKKRKRGRPRKVVAPREEEEEEERELVDTGIDSNTVLQQQTCPRRTVAQPTVKTPSLKGHLKESGTDDVKCNMKRKRGRPWKVVVPREEKEEEEEQQPRYRPRACKKACPVDVDSVQDMDDMHEDEEYGGVSS